MWIVNFIRELKAWRIVRKEYRRNKNEFLKFGIKSDWFGRLYKVINRDPDVVLGDELDEVLLHKETAEIWSLLVKYNIVDILAYELKPLDGVNQINETQEEFENGYLITLTPAWNLDKQYVTIKSVICVVFLLVCIIYGLVYSTINWIIPFTQTLWV